MSFFGGGDTQTSTSTMNQNTAGGTSYAPWTQDMHKGIAGLALGMNQNFLTPQQQGVAGFNPDQFKGFDMLRGSALQYGQGTGTPSAGTMMDKSKMSAAQLGSGDYQAFMNPFVQSVIDPALQNIQRQKLNTGAEIDARAAASGAFGGSRGALQRSQLDRSTAETTAQMVPALMSAAYDRATGLASQNVDRQQQANSANANNALQAYGLDNTFQNSDLNRQLASIQALLGGGQMQQDLTQRGLDLGNERLQFIASLIPGVFDSSSFQTIEQNSTDTKPDDAASPFQQLLGVGSTILGSDVKGGGTLGGNWFSKLLGMGG